MNPVSLQHLMVFVTIAEHEQLQSAAIDLCLTPSAVSTQLRQLEDRLGLSLFDRHSRGMLLTPQGKTLLEQAKGLIEQARAFEQTASELKNHLSGHFIVGIQADPMFLGVPQWVSELHEHQPDIHLTLKESNSLHIVQKVSQGEWHGGFVYGPVPTSFNKVWIKRIKLAVIAPHDWRDKVRSDNLLQFPWIGWHHYCPFDEAIKQALPDIKDKGFVVASEDTRTREQLVAAGLGLSLIEADLVEHSAQGRKLYCVNDFRCELDLHFIYHPQAARQPAFQAALASLKQQQLHHK